MASPIAVLFGVFAAIGFFTLVGRALLQWLRPSFSAPAGLAPTLGWAVFTALSFPLQDRLGFSRLSTGALVLATLIGALALTSRHRRRADLPQLPFWAPILAAALASIPLIALLPKPYDGGFIIGVTAFDHSKVAMIDEITRLGLPAGNPFFGADGARGHLTYYYLWHFSAAQLSSLTGISGWEADAAMTGFTAYASVLLMMGLTLGAVARIAPRGGRWRPDLRWAAVLLVALLCLAGSVRPILSQHLGQGRFGRFLSDYYPVEAWMDQASWTPQHLAAACCSVLAVLLIAALSRRPSLRASLTLGPVCAAGFGSSTWVGGVTFVLAGAAAGAALMITTRDWTQRGRLLACVLGGGVLALVLASPFIWAEAGLAAARGTATLAFHPYEVFGEGVPSTLRRVLDLPGFWLVRLPMDLPAVFPLAAVALVVYRSRLLGSERRDPSALALAVFAIGGLCVAWLLASVIGNNDLGWRAVLPAILIMTPLAAATLAQWIRQRRYLRLAASAALIALSVPDGLIAADLAGRATENAPDFAAAPALWSAVRRYAGPADRVANNPQSEDDITEWPVNPSWAFLANRPSCYSGWETARAYVDMPLSKLKEIDQRLVRVFDGSGSPQDVEVLARDYGCRVVALVETDGAWASDPFRGSDAYRLVEEKKDQWRIYVATGSKTMPRGPK